MLHCIQRLGYVIIKRLQKNINMVGNTQPVWAYLLQVEGPKIHVNSEHLMKHRSNNGVSTLQNFLCKKISSNTYKKNMIISDETFSFMKQLFFFKIE